MVRRAAIQPIGIQARLHAWMASEFGVPPHLEPLLGKFSRGWNIFTRLSGDKRLKRKELDLADRVHNKRQWGRRAEDPFRGLRAGPVRFSPLFYLL